MLKLIRKLMEVSVVFTDHGEDSVYASALHVRQKKIRITGFQNRFDPSNDESSSNQGFRDLAINFEVVCSAIYTDMSPKL